MKEALDIRVRGIVQGVGYRPFVYRLAQQHLVSGWVLNDREGVLIHAEAESALLDSFVTELADVAPVSAKVSEIELTEVPLCDCEHFEIRESAEGDTSNPTQISADLGICEDCTRELLDPQNRRYRYPFINCTNCGPRFTIIDELPYDRPRTSMREFVMCDECAYEYTDPADRRFHAQPDACFLCGPELSWYERDKGGEIVTIFASDRTSSDALLEKAINLLAEGGILAVKGLGGFHLVCDASNEQAIERLRVRKQRDGKPFAVMMGALEDIERYCLVSTAEQEQLSAPARPIVLLKKRNDAQFACGLADDLQELGVMLPTTPVQVLLMSDFKERKGKDMLVMTSGNYHNEPIVIDDNRAVEQLFSIADAILGNNRKILSRFDDSVLRVLDLGDQEAVQFIRRARGFAPVPLAVGYGTPEDSVEREHSTVFAAGSEQKNTLAYSQAQDVYVSQYIGDVEDADVLEAWHEAKKRIESLYRLSAHALACDLHPEYLTSKWARSTAFKTGLPLTEVQHHHAHIASVLGEHNLYGPSCGVAFDGTGFGADGNIWGGEVLIANQIDYERFANLTYMPLIGGSAAIEHPLRMAYGMLWTYDLLDHPAASALLEELGDEEVVFARMIDQDINTPYTSSMGRLFDGVAALIGVCTNPRYEGEAAILLDAHRASHESATGEELAKIDARYAFTLQKNAATEQSTAHDTSVVMLDAQSTLHSILDDLQAGVDPSLISLRFHRAVVSVIIMLAELVRELYGITLVVLSGGCFMNRFLVEQTAQRLNEQGFTVALNAGLPPNDGCISYGQCVVASVSR